MLLCDSGTALAELFGVNRRHLFGWIAVALIRGADAAPPPPPPDCESLEEAELDPKQLYGASSASLADTVVSLDAVPVRSKSGNGVWVGYSPHRQIYVVPPDPSSIGFLTVGAKVDIHGTLRVTPSAGQATLSFAMDRGSAGRLARDHIYIDAWSMTSATH
jgi:hypothetical protein